ncbi:DUF4893 domain-containing protein [Sulfitobacter alexandrii]|uniref:DUF4893 domain-containing protein n=1 Tax=Sulfitobacter alexandrii TaxID=1917485 RepID=A0A1J0WJ14_9RHOB|nr:DUF4893 domain-containing protein [Sulfitobacter alexandrii]APE44293.1 DUF4893 domain-containing protein [Sulfitobacter alexandrii]
MKPCLGPALALLLTATAAPAQVDLRAADAARLDGFESAAGRALLQALAGGAEGDVAALVTALSGTPQVAFDETLAGDWSCRTMKLGGISALVVYTDFRCRFTLRPDGTFAFEKLTGSQLTHGTISFREGRAVYVGVGYVADETPADYADLPADFVSDGRVQTDVAVFERVSPRRARLMFPAPAVESDFDILELTR